MTGVTITKRRNEEAHACFGCTYQPLHLYSIMAPNDDGMIAELCMSCLRGLAVALVSWVDVDAACEEAGR